MDMEGNRNQNISTTTLCRAGCGFYGNQAFDGMCSKCYKDAVKRKQNAPVTGGRGTPSQADCGSSSSSIVEDVTAAMTPQTTPSVETATPTVAIPVATPSSMDDTSSTTADKSEESGTGGAASTSSGMEGSPGGSEEKKSKKNRCSTCKKKVGLTGFECRCGGLYCSLHRYSDKHDCQFDYKEMAQEQIRRNNPVVVGAKIQKL